MAGKVYLVGAGPGDPKLMTLKGKECIARADVVLYDRLAGDHFLAYARPEAELIYVGKDPEHHAVDQGAINALLVQKAGEGKVVVRVKGGDPFLFGRGGEEAEALVEHGIPYEVVPGVTSAIAAPAYAGIPLTHRDCSSSVGIFTGREREGKELTSLDWARIATGLETLVFLMGMKNLEFIASRLMAHGRSADTPVALVRWGSRPEQETLVGRLGDIAERAREAGFRPPAAIVVGEVVRLREKLRWFESRPLFGRRVLVTRSRAQASALCERIEELGGEAIEFPVIRILPPESYEPLDRAIEALPGYRWAVFTSANGVEYFFDRLEHLGKDARSLAGVRVCAIGPQTARGLRARGIRPDLVPGEYRAEAILEGLRDSLAPGDRVLMARADLAREFLPRELRRLGVEVVEVVAYRTGREVAGGEEIRHRLEEGEIHAVTFTSSSTVKNFLQALGEGAAGLLRGVTVACIGPVTADTARQMGVRVDVVPEEYTIPGLVEALARSLAGGIDGR